MVVNPELQGLSTFQHDLLGFRGLSMLDASPMDVGQMTSSVIVPISQPLTTGASTLLSRVALKI